MTTPPSIHADPDEIELHARDVDRLCAFFAELLPTALDVPSGAGTELYWGEDDGELPGWPELCRVVAENEQAALEASGLLLREWEATAAGLHRAADSYRDSDLTAATRMYRKRA